MLKGAARRLRELILLLLAGDRLRERYRDHPLKGSWKGYRDAHIEPDWLLIYRIIDEELHLVRTGTPYGWQSSSGRPPLDKCGASRFGHHWPSRNYYALVVTRATLNTLGVGKFGRHTWPRTGRTAFD